MSRHQFSFIFTRFLLTSFCLVFAQGEISVAKADPIPPPITVSQPVSPPAPRVVAVPISECSSCAFPNPSGCCSFVALGCTRTDSGPIITVPGVPKIMMRIDTDCYNCCKFKPEECPGNVNIPVQRNCTIPYTVSDIQSASVSLASVIGATAGINALEITGDLSEAVCGARVPTPYTFTVSCGLWAARCKAAMNSTLFSRRIGRTAIMRHSWNINGLVLQNNPANGPACTPPCPFHAQPFDRYCNSALSIGVGATKLEGGCSGRKPLDCDSIMPSIECGT